MSGITGDCSFIGDHISNEHLKWVVYQLAHNPTYHQGRNLEGAKLDTKETMVNDLKSLAEV